jgi:hypothetical protein
MIKQKQFKKELERSLKMLIRDENDKNIANYYVTYENIDDIIQKL